ncbi:Inositol-3-phosphate synthase [Neolecta irregularis DAH-3]|uniref:Inositol-3-phosphate synthase n=1 Tax=Neolecta irregularis (strain DAH-3) TaxID=1198029 RepID=A0A1U7LNB4_NEOID|nr:Inositol-3-phosphate synthase [Neolecta irregularis DAH-3]|eukprot:OLL24129.1 Inositol-3-phosphate synthase [Neolecta irregularis DAH-3]
MAPHAIPQDLSIGASSNGSAARDPSVFVDAPNVKYEANQILSEYVYENAHVIQSNDRLIVRPTKSAFEFKTETHVRRTGLMMIGLGGNNGSTLTATIVANRSKTTFQTKNGLQESNYYGSVTQSSTLKLGIDAQGKDVYVPFSQIVPMVHPNDLVIGGWDINSANLANAMSRAKVLEYDLQRQVSKELSQIKPLPSIYYPDFIAANQSDRADNLIPGNDKSAHLEHIRKDIRDFKQKNRLERVVVIWTANTERYADVIPGVNDTADNLLEAVKSSHAEIAPSTIFALACILEGVPFINGAPQNTLVPGCIELAEQKRSFIGGDGAFLYLDFMLTPDFKSGQTKIKSVLAQFLVDAGIRPLSIVSYNHLGNNDGKNLSAPQQFRSKEISKASVVDDVISSNQILFNDKVGKNVDHCIVIKYVPAVGDSKVAMDEYHSELMMGGRNTISMHTVCEDSLLASPLIIDLVVVAELFSRVQYRSKGETEWKPFYSVLSVLSYWLKAPVTRPGTDVVNGLNKQRACLENLLRAFVGMAPANEMKLEEKSMNMEK